MTPKDKQSLLEGVLRDINRRYGEGSITTLAQRPKFDGQSISTGSLSLDRAIGVGGIPRGRTTEISGWESSGKTTVMQHLVAETQMLGETAAFVDMEHALDEDYAIRCGVDMEKLLISQPDTGEQAMEIVEALARSGEVALIVFDSVAKLVTRAEVEGDMGDAEMGSRARLMGQALRKLSPIIRKNNVALVFTNQMRQKIGVIYGSPETTPAGNALPFEASVRIRLKKVNKETDEKHAHIEARVIKNKVAPPFKACKFDIFYDKGIDKIADLVSVASEIGVIASSGSWYNFGEHKWHGLDAIDAELRADAKLADEILRKVRETK